MKEVPFRATVEGDRIPVPENVREEIDLDDGDVVTASILLNSGDVGGPDEDVRPVLYDKRAAFLTMDALERQVVAAVRAEEFEVAAEVAETLFLVQVGLPEWTDEYHTVSTEFEVEEGQIARSMAEVYEWTVENDHKTRKWFEDGPREVE